MRRCGTVAQPRVARRRKGKPGPTQHNRASESEQLLRDGKKYVAQENPPELQEFVENVEAFDASMGTLSAVSSASGFQVYCLAMTSRILGWLGGRDFLVSS